MRLKEYVKDGEKGALAHKSSIGRDYLSRYIRGHCLPTPNQAESLAEALDVRPYELYEEKEIAFFCDTAKEAKQAAKAPNTRKRKYTYNFSFRATQAFAKSVDKVMRLYGFQNYREMVKYMVDRMIKEKSPVPTVAPVSGTSEIPKTCNNSVAQSEMAVK